MENRLAQRFIFGRPMPAPKPSSRTLSGDVYTRQAQHNILGQRQAGGRAAGAAVQARQPLYQPLHLIHLLQRHGQVIVQLHIGRREDRPVQADRAGHIQVHSLRSRVIGHLCQQRLDPLLGHIDVYKRQDMGDLQVDRLLMNSG